MRCIGWLLLLAATRAGADASAPAAGGVAEDDWVHRCAERLARVGRELAAVEPAFADAQAVGKTDRIEHGLVFGTVTMRGKHLGVTIAPSGKESFPVQWSYDPRPFATTHRWSGFRSGSGLSAYISVEETSDAARARVEAKLPPVIDQCLAMDRFVGAPRPSSSTGTRKR